MGSDDDGYAVRLRLKHFLAYVHDREHARDDSPLYIFDGTFGERATSKALCQDYSIPTYFSEDLMRLAGEKRRPPYRSLACAWHTCSKLQTGNVYTCPAGFSGRVALSVS